MVVANLFGGGKRGGHQKSALEPHQLCPRSRALSVSPALDLFAIVRNDHPNDGRWKCEIDPTVYRVST